VPGALLAIDVGNTQTVFGLYEDGRLAQHWRAATEPARTGDELGVLVRSLLDLDRVEANHAALRAALPDVALTSVVLPSVDLPAAVLGGAIDLALARCALDAESLRRTVVRRERLGAAVPSGHPLAEKAAAEVGALRDEPLLVHDAAANPRHHALILQVCRDAGFEPRLVAAATPFDPGYAAIAAGEAVSIVGESARDGLPAALAWVALDTARRVEVSLLVRADEREPSVGRVVEAMLGDARALGWI
jgi:hypothetical protein